MSLNRSILFLFLSRTVKFRAFMCENSRRDACGVSQNGLKMKRESQRTQGAIVNLVTFGHSISRKVVKRVAIVTVKPRVQPGGL